MEFNSDDGEDGLAWLVGWRAQHRDGTEERGDCASRGPSALLRSHRAVEAVMLGRDDG